MPALVVTKKLGKNELFAGVASEYAKGGAKSVANVVDVALDAYNKTAFKLHIAACLALFHASETGDSRPLTKFFSGLRQNDKDALRVWLGKATTIKTIDEKGEETEVKYLGFKKDVGFAIKKGTEAIRKGYLDLETMLNGTSFQDIDQEKEKPEIGLAEIMAMLARIEAKTKKKADDNDVQVPEAVLKQLASLTATVAAQMEPATNTKQ